MEFRTEAVLLPHERCVSIVCESVEESFLGYAKQTFNFCLPPSASVDEVRGLLAEKLSIASSTVHLQVLVRESGEYETVTRGTIGDILSVSSRDASALTLVYSTESRYGCFYVCCAALCAGCCCLGYQAGRQDQRKKQRHRPPRQQHHKQPYEYQTNACAQYPQAAPINQYYQNTNAQPPQNYAYGAPVQYTPQPQQNAYYAAQPNVYGSPPQQYQSYGGNQAPGPL